MKGKLLGLAVTLLLSACGAPTLDGSSEEALKKSGTAVRESLPAEQRTAFDQAMMAIAMTELFANGATSETGTAAVRAKLDGKTGQQVLDIAAAMKAEREAKEREQALAEIVDLRAKRDRAAQAVQQLAAFKVERSRLVFRDQMFGRPQPIIELVVVNGTGSAVSRAYFRGTVASPGRAVPWIREVFNYQIPGGLEPNERAEWNLEPNMFSEWSRDIPDDAVMTVEVTRLDGADEKALYDAEGLSDRELRRLEELEKKFGA